MSGLERLRSDMGFAGRRAYQVDEDQTEACLAVLDEFIVGHEVVEVDAFPVEGMARVRRWFAHPRDTQYGEGGATPDRVQLIVPREQEPRITDHTLTERMAVLEDEVQHRCGCLGRRVNALEFKRDRPLLEAADAVLERITLTGRNAAFVCSDMREALTALAEVIKEERGL